jgi:hypothetical protein
MAAMVLRTRRGTGYLLAGHTRLTALWRVFFAFGKIALPSLPALKTSLFALPLLPAAEGPANRSPAPHLTLPPPTGVRSSIAGVARSYICIDSQAARPQILHMRILRKMP